MGLICGVGEWRVRCTFSKWETDLDVVSGCERFDVVWCIWLVMNEYIYGVEC